MNIYFCRTATAALYIILLCLASWPAAGQTAKPVRDLKPTVILISLDGFRYDYLDKYRPETLNRLAREGVRAKWMVPSFPTKTFPNHYTIVTGLYPAHHGIVENNIYDFGEVFRISDRKKVGESRWWLGEPIWVTAEKQGQVAASYFFVGSEAEIAGERPDIWRAYNGRVPPAMRVDKVLSWLDLPREKRPTMITLYFSDTDDAGHEFGPDAEEVQYAVWDVDRYITRLMDGLKRRGIDKKVNVIIVSDHGMAPVDVRKAVFMDDYFDLDDAEQVLYTHEVNQIFPKPGKLDEIYSKLQKMPHAACWKKAEIPERLHYRDGRRVAPIVCSTEIGHIVTTRKRYEDFMKEIDDPARPRGGHGHDNKYREMMATYVAHGPAFRRGMVAEPFPNVDVYNLMCRILGLKPAKNDGDIERVKVMLR
ncbi:MAG: ectonucleotide pyrophosphatase/phosphodiesterase [Pyrinomonadaceae bacterium]